MGSSMRLRRRLLLLVPLLAVAKPIVAKADEAHSWCIPGHAKNPQGSTVQQVNTIVGQVCSTSGFGYCCESLNGKWDIACIQTGSNYAYTILNQDVCGRHSWTQGPVANGHSDQHQYYPRDFSIFAVGGAVSGISDVHGPIGAAGSISASSFIVNADNQEGLALVTLKNLVLRSGTIRGNAIYGNDYSVQNVTYDHGSNYLVGPLSFPINFDVTKAKLQAMSQALSLYPTTPGATAKRDSNNNGMVVFKGTDPTLNVFSIPDGLFQNTYTYSFDVPLGSTVIVNVNSSDPVIQNASFTDAAGRPLGPINMLWNFVNAVTLTVQSTHFVASILAPYAAAYIKWAMVTGTVATWNFIGDAEIHLNPFHMPGCGGCLCLDPNWSCSNGTTLDDDKTPSTLGPEAGFLLIDGGQYTAENTTRYAPDHRMWYSFRPADVRPKDAPLAVFFNGGPGNATSSVLFAWGTGPTTFVDGTGDGTSVVMQSNASSWTQFANLLYIDAPATGFSYPLPRADNPVNDVGIDIDDDAGIFLRVMVQFLRRHPTLIHNPVMLVGESYGGTRASLMLNYLYNYDKIKVGGGGAYQNQRVYSDLTTTTDSKSCRCGRKSAT